MSEGRTTAVMFYRTQGIMHEKMGMLDISAVSLVQKRILEHWETKTIKNSVK